MRLLRTADTRTLLCTSSSSVQSGPYNCMDLWKLKLRVKNKRMREREKQLTPDKPDNPNIF